MADADRRGRPTSRSSLRSHDADETTRLGELGRHATPSRHGPARGQRHQRDLQLRGRPDRRPRRRVRLRPLGQAGARRPGRARSACSRRCARKVARAAPRAQLERVTWPPSEALGLASLVEVREAGTRAGPCRRGSGGSGRRGGCARRWRGRSRPRSPARAAAPPTRGRARRSSGSARAVPLSPVSSGASIERRLRFASRREAGDVADRAQLAAVVEAEDQRADRALLLARAPAHDDAVDRPLALHLRHPLALARARRGRRAAWPSPPRSCAATARPARRRRSGRSARGRSRRRAARAARGAPTSGVSSSTSSPSASRSKATKLAGISFDEQVDPRLGRVDPALQRVEHRLALGVADHQLAVERRSGPAGKLSSGK